MAVYVIGPHGGPFKVGKANNPQQRLMELQTGSPVKLHIFKVIEGSTILEKQIHATLKSEGKHSHGEWFHLTEDDIQSLGYLAYADKIELPTITLYPNPQYPGSVQVGAWCKYCGRFHLHGMEKGWEDKPMDSRTSHCSDGPWVHMSYWLKPILDADLLPVKAQRQLKKIRNGR